MKLEVSNVKQEGPPDLQSVQKIKKKKCIFFCVFRHGIAHSLLDKCAG